MRLFLFLHYLLAIIDINSLLCRLTLQLHATQRIPTAIQIFNFQFSIFNLNNRGRLSIAEVDAERGNTGACLSVTHLLRVDEEECAASSEVGTTGSVAQRTFDLSPLTLVL